MSTDAGATNKDEKHLSLGILLMAPLPEVPGFEIHLDRGVHSSCCLLAGGCVKLRDGKRCVSVVC